MINLMAPNSAMRRRKKHSGPPGAVPVVAAYSAALAGRQRCSSGRRRNSAARIPLVRRSLLSFRAMAETSDRKAARRHVSRLRRDGRPSGTREDARVFCLLRLVRSLRPGRRRQDSLTMPLRTSFAVGAQWPIEGENRWSRPANPARARESVSAVAESTIRRIGFRGGSVSVGGCCRRFVARNDAPS